MNERIAKGLVVTGKVALALFDGASAAQLIDHCTGAHIERRLWYTRLEQSRALLVLLVGEKCERDVHENEPEPGHEATCVLCYADEVLRKEVPTLTEMIDATQQVMWRIDNFDEIDMAGLGEVLTYWGNIE